MKINKLIAASILVIGNLFSENISAQDWPNLKKYQKENQLTGLPGKNEQRIIFYGNSITEQWKEKHPVFFREKNYINRGISGQTTPQMLIRFRQDVIDLKPKAVVILAGTNDLAGNTGPSSLKMITHNIFSMAELAKIHGIKVILSSILPVYDYPWRKGIFPSEKIKKLNESLKNYAEANQMIYLDYYNAMVDNQKGLRKDLSEDGVHPNVKGYKIMEPLVKEAIAKALNN